MNMELFVVLWTYNWSFFENYLRNNSASNHCIFERHLESRSSRFATMEISPTVIQL